MEKELFHWVTREVWETKSQEEYDKAIVLCNRICRRRWGVDVAMLAEDILDGTCPWDGFAWRVVLDRETSLLKLEVLERLQLSTDSPTPDAKFTSASEDSITP